MVFEMVELNVFVTVNQLCIAYVGNERGVISMIVLILATNLRSFGYRRFYLGRTALKFFY
ncbi:MAG: hypothetical protein FKGGLIKP_00937 [Sodalis sp. Fse]|nr:MAG: hypothetical protein FKGGLIKP_00937 [Sodalis sp. Fse]